MMKKQLLLIAATSALTAFSGSPAQAQTIGNYVTPIVTAVDTPKFLKGSWYSWYSKTIRWNGEYPRVTWSEALVHLKGEYYDSSIYGSLGKYTRDEHEIRNYGGFLNTRQDNPSTGLFVGSPWVDSFTYVYQQTKTSVKPNVFSVRVSELRGQSALGVAKGKVGLMLRSTLDCDSPYVMIALTNENGPQLSVRYNKSGPAQTVKLLEGTPSFTDAKYRSKYADISLTRTSSNEFAAFVQYEGEMKYYIGKVKLTDPSYYVGLAAAANTSADSKWSSLVLGTLRSNNNKDPQGRTYKQWQGGDLASFSRLFPN